MASVEVDGYSMLQSNRLECEVVNFHQTHTYRHNTHTPFLVFSLKVSGYSANAY